MARLAAHRLPSLRMRDRLVRFDRPWVVGILNVTPDSFSDGGLYFSVEAAVRRGLEMAEAGADLIDVGGMSTRPRGAVYGEGAVPVDVAEERRRVVPVIEGLARACPVPLSVDTFRADVARAALEAGACMVNDVRGLDPDEALADAVRATGAALVLMHMRGTPETTFEHASFGDVVADVRRELGQAVERAVHLGVPREAIAVDPGLGFGKLPADNWRLVARLDALAELGRPVYVGPSRKSFLAEAAVGAPPAQRDGATAGVVAACVLAGASLIRVHDVALMRQVVDAAARVRAVAHEALRGG